MLTHSEEAPCLSAGKGEDRFAHLPPAPQLEGDRPQVQQAVEQAGTGAGRFAPAREDGRVEGGGSQGGGGGGGGGGGESPTREHVRNH